MTDDPPLLDHPIVLHADGVTARARLQEGLGRLLADTNIAPVVNIQYRDDGALHITWRDRK